MLADFWGPYLVTIAGVATTGFAVFLGRLIWRWATASAPSLVYVDVGASPGELWVRNNGDFTVHLRRVEALGEPHPWKQEAKRRLPPGKTTPFDVGDEVARHDRSYRVSVRDDHKARWELTYDSHRPSSGTFLPSSVSRTWPWPVRWALLTWHGFKNAARKNG